MTSDFLLMISISPTHASTHTLTIYNNDGWPLTVQQQANVLTSRINAPVPTRMYGVTCEYSTFNSKYWCNSTCIQIPAQKIANPDAWNQQQQKKERTEMFFASCMKFLSANFKLKRRICAVMSSRISTLYTHSTETVAFCSSGSVWAWEYVDKRRQTRKNRYLLLLSPPPNVDTFVANTVELCHIFVIKTFDDLTCNKLTTPLNMMMTMCTHFNYVLRT